GELELEALRVAEDQTRVAPFGRDAGLAQSLLPEVERLGRGNPPHDAVDHPRACLPSARARVLEEGDVRAGRADLVRVEEVVNGRVVLVDSLLHHPQTQRSGVELDVARRVRRDA